MRDFSSSYLASIIMQGSNIVLFSGVSVDSDKDSFRRYEISVLKYSIVARALMILGT